MAKGLAVVVVVVLVEGAVHHNMVLQLPHTQKGDVTPSQGDVQKATRVKGLT
jgi:hypothetical protein